MSLSKAVSVFVLLLIFYAFKAHGSTSEKDISTMHNSLIGVILNSDSLGFQGEKILKDQLGIRFSGLYVFGLCVRENEYIYTTTLAPSYYFQSGDPHLKYLVFGGLAYSIHHWEIKHKKFINSGNIYDLTIGGGGGISIKLNQQVQIGMNIWINYDYKTVRETYFVRKGKRFLLPLLFLDFNFLF